MFELLKDMPDDVLAIRAHGRITHEDYRDTLIPAAEKMLEDGRNIKCLFITNEDFEGYDLGAMWDDATFGIKHWNRFSHIAVVTGVAYIRVMMTMFTPLFPAEVKLFEPDEQEQAKDWIIMAGHKQAA